MKTIQPVRGAAGSLIRLDARIKGAKPIQVQWLQDGEQVPHDMTHKTVEEDDLFTLLILEASSMDRGIYECVAVNAVGEAKCEATVDVIPAGGRSGSGSAATSPPVSGVTSPRSQSQTISPGQIKKPEVIEKLKNITVHEGKEVVFKTRVANTNGKQIEE